VEIGGLEEEPKDTYDEIYAVIQKEMRRIAPLVQLEPSRSISRSTAGGRTAGSIPFGARFTTAHRIYIAHEFDWTSGRPDGSSWTRSTRES